MNTNNDDISKPDLIIHSLYIEALKNYDLSKYFNVLSLNDLKSQMSPMNESYIITNNYAAPIKLTLMPFYTPTQLSSNSPTSTSYVLTRPTKIYKISRNSPRYIIWTKNDPLLICGTVVDRIDYWELFEAFQRAKSWVYEILEFKSIAVFDLDKTLINDNCEKITEAEKLLKYAKHNYDLIALWSHGSALHVDEQVEKFSIDNQRGPDIFNLIIKSADTKSPKNLLTLYNYLPFTKFTKSVLIDDLVANWTPEYDKFLIPYNNTTLKQALYLI